MKDPTQTGEWTERIVGELLCDDIALKVGPRQRIADAHNAALAAERIATVNRLDQQLAKAVQEATEPLRKQLELCTMNTSDIETLPRLRKELEAEREETVKLAIQRDEANDKAEQLRKKLEEARRIISGLLGVYEQLHAMYDIGDCQYTVDGRAFLAKTK